MTIKFRWFLFLITLLFPIAAFAHGAVTTRQQIVGDYKIEFEYNTSGTINAGDYIIYDTYLLDNSDDQPIDYSSMFIRIEKKSSNAIAAATLVEVNKGYTTYSLTIPDPGTYTAAISYYKDGKVIVPEISFDFEVQRKLGGTSSKVLLFIGLFILGMAIGGSGIWWFKTKAKHA